MKSKQPKDQQLKRASDKAKTIALAALRGLKRNVVFLPQGENNS